MPRGIAVNTSPFHGEDRRFESGRGNKWGYGGIGRRAGLRNRCQKWRVSSSLTIPTKCSGGGIGRREGLKIPFLRECGFESHSEYKIHSRQIRYRSGLQNLDERVRFLPIVQDA